MTRVGVVGIGAMGGAMAECLLRKGFDVIVRDIVPERVEALVRIGARAAPSAAEIARSAEIILTVVIDAQQTDAVLFGDGADAGVAGAASAATTVVMCSTVAPAYVVSLALRLSGHGIALVDA